MNRRLSTALGSSIVVLLLAIAAATLIAALSLYGPAFSPTTGTRNVTFNCSWTWSGDTSAQNITLLLDGAYYNSSYENASLTNLSSSLLLSGPFLLKDHTWTCQVTLYNDSGSSTTAQTSMDVVNAPPSFDIAPGGIFNGSGADIGTLVQIREKQAMSFRAVAADIDPGEAFTYEVGGPGTFCAVQQASNEGNYTCTPQQSDLVGNVPTLVNVSFLVDDGSAVSYLGARRVTFNITPVNDPPIIAVVPLSAPVNSSYAHNFSVTDEENDYPYTFSIVNPPPAIADKINITAANAQGTLAQFIYNGVPPDYTDIGAYTITINVTDNSTDYLGVNDSTSAIYNFTLNITPVGMPPYFTVISVGAPNANGYYTIPIRQPVAINISANDPNTQDPGANVSIVFLNNSYFSITTVKAQANTTSDAFGQTVFTPTKAMVGLQLIDVTIRDDTYLTNSTQIALNITNVNDPPTVNEMSYNATNMPLQQNASDLVAYSNTPFAYTVNATDPDVMYGYDNDFLTYGSNSTLFAINATTGLIGFTPGDSDVSPSPYAINVTVHDNFGHYDSRVIFLTVTANTPPYFTGPLPQLNCSTGNACALNLSSYANDTEDGSVSNYSIAPVGPSIPTFAYNASTGIVNFTPSKSDVGNFTVNVTLIDSKGATNASVMDVSIANTPVPPVLVHYDLALNETGGAQTIVAEHVFTYQLKATDDDLFVPSANEVVNFSTNLSVDGLTIGDYSIINNTVTAQLSFNASDLQNGTYSIWINATDRFGNFDSKNVTFTILPWMPPPNITQFTPWGADNATHDMQESYANTSDPRFAGGVAIVNTTEGIDASTPRTLSFAVNVSSVQNLTYRWTINGTPAGADADSFSMPLNFSSDGHYSVMVNVSNDRLESSQWRWDLYIQDTDRPPVLVNPLDDEANITSTTRYNGYFYVNTSVQSGKRFDDPDITTDNDTLSFSVQNSCQYATFTVSGADLVVVPVQVGSCLMLFNATDSHGATAQSNLVTFNISAVPTGNTPSPTTQQSSGGGGGSSSPIIIPITRDNNQPKAFNLIAPRLVTIYSNNSIDIPIVINNTWNGPLKMLRLTAETNATGVKTSFDTDLFENLPQNQSRLVTLTVSNYRLGQNYEVRVIGNVTDPPYQDSALILLNSIQQSSEGNDVQVKVTFANDLVNQHPECQELNEVLDQAKKKIAEGDLQGGQQLVDGVINGCQYLISTQQKIQEKPSQLNPIISIDDLSIKAIMLGVLAFVVLLSVALLIYYHYSHKPEEDI